VCLITTKQQQSRGTCWHDYLCDVCVCVARTPSNGGDVDAPSFACAHVNLKGLCSFFFLLTACSETYPLYFVKNKILSHFCETYP